MRSSLAIAVRGLIVGSSAGATPFLSARSSMSFTVGNRVLPAGAVGAVPEPSSVLLAMLR